MSKLAPRRYGDKVQIGGNPERPLQVMHRHFRHFGEGGAVPHEGRVVEYGDFLLPLDVDPMVVALAINEKLRDGQTTPGLGDDPMRLLERRAGGRLVVSGHHLVRLGDGNLAKGKQFMHGLIVKLRRP